MSKGKQIAFGCDPAYRLEIGQLRDDSDLLSVPKHRVKAEAVLRGYHAGLGAPNLHAKGATEIRRYLTSEEWVVHLTKSQSQTRLWKQLTGGNHNRPALHLAGWLIASEIFTNLPQKVTNCMSFLWSEPFPDKGPFFPTTEMTGYTQL